MAGVRDSMSNIPKSKRKPTSTEFFDKFLKLRVKVTQFITDDFSDIKVRYFQNTEGLILERHDFWKSDETRRSILRILTDMLDHITHANSIFPVCIEEYYKRRELSTLAIGDCEYLIQELQCASIIHKLNATKYILLTEDIMSFEASLKRWRKSDNKFLKKLNNSVIIDEGLPL